jgi:hypothetical protein
MASDIERGPLFRAVQPKLHSRVTYAELVFVFAVTQISHTLLGRFTPLGALQTTLLFLAGIDLAAIHRRRIPVGRVPV